MINFIYGTHGSGKTTLVFEKIKDSLSAGKKCFLIIPDQEAVQFECMALDILPAQSQINLETVGFSRLYNRLCREYGGLSYSYLTKPIRSLLMWKTIQEIKPLIHEYSLKNSDLYLNDLMISAIGEFKASGINPTMLETAAKKINDDPVLTGRLSDLSLIYACFENLISEKYSDSADDISKLYELLCKHPFFDGYDVYIDSFTSFTAVQHKVIKHIFRYADNTCITIPLLYPNDNRISSESIVRSLKILKESAESFGNIEETILKGNKRSRSKALSYLTENLWLLDKSDTENSPDPTGRIICEICGNPYSEAEAVAAHIRQLLRDGARCRDMVIVMRDDEKYRGIIEPALRKSDIPFFLSEKSDMCSSPAVKFILSALKIKKFNWQISDVISHIKTGLCNIDVSDANLFEEYISTWKISGASFYESEWNMNPDGFSPDISERGKLILEGANRVRQKLYDPLANLFDALDTASEISDKCRAVYAYLRDIDFESKLHSLSESSAKRGDIKQAREHSRMYSVILSSLADIGQTIGDDTADDEEFAQILKTVFDKTEIGSIPTSIDEVMIGSASMLRSSNQKYAFIMGLCENEFPASTNDTGLLCATDKEKLRILGIEFSNDTDTRASDELMYVERAFSIPSEKIFLFTHSSEIGGNERYPSIAFNRVLKLFHGFKPHVFRNDDLEYLIPAPKNAASILRTIKDDTTRKSLTSALEKYIPNIGNASRQNSGESKCEVTPQLAHSVLGTTLHLSPSSFEKYVKCPFSYYCSSVLHLREPKNTDIKANDIGTFIHFVIEKLIKVSIPTNEEEGFADDKTIVKNTDMAVDEYIHRVFPQYLIENPKMKHLYSRLRTLSILLVKNIIDEFSHSDFRPVFFELPTNGTGRNPTPLFFKLSDGTDISFSGKIDRVDLYKHGDDVYVRVVDYKTGTKQFSINDISHGVNLQMLLYLFSLCRSNSSKFRQSIGVAPGKNSLPAGIMYLSANVAMVEVDDYMEISDVMKNASKGVERTGILLNNEDILHAMNKELDRNFIMNISKNKDGVLTGNALTGTDGFSGIYKQLEAVIVKFATELYSGLADARPLKYGKTIPCTYCEAKSICRKSLRNGDNS